MALKSYLKRKMKKYAKKAARKAARRVPRALRPSSQRASIRETIEINAGTGAGTTGFANQVLNRVFSLSQFPRASSLAPNFKYYRAKSVTWTYTPFNNTYQQDYLGVPNAPDLSIPQFYHVMNRTMDTYPIGQARYSALQALEAQGAVARVFTKKIVVSYRPNWCQAGAPMVSYTGTPPNTAVTLVTMLNNTTSYKKVACPNWSILGQPNQSPVTIDPNSSNGSSGQMPATHGEWCVWGGHLDFIRQVVSLPNEQLYTLECSVDWEFTEPNFIVKGDRVDELPAVAT